MEDFDKSTSENLSNGEDQHQLDIDMEENNNFDDNIHDPPAVIKNRRYNKMMELMETSDFFNEENIKMMEPLLYYIYIGRYKRNFNVKGTSNFTVKDICLQQLDEKLYEQKLYQEYLQKPDYFNGAEEESMEISNDPSKIQEIDENSDKNQEVDLSDNEDDLI